MEGHDAADLGGRAGHVGRVVRGAVAVEVPLQPGHAVGGHGVSGEGEHVTRPAVGTAPQAPQVVGDTRRPRPHRRLRRAHVQRGLGAPDVEAVPRPRGTRHGHNPHLRLPGTRHPVGVRRRDALHDEGVDDVGRVVGGAVTVEVPLQRRHHIRGHGVRGEREGGRGGAVAEALHAVPARLAARRPPAHRRRGLAPLEVEVDLLLRTDPVQAPPLAHRSAGRHSPHPRHERARRPVCVGDGDALHPRGVGIDVGGGVEGAVAVEVPLHPVDHTVVDPGVRGQRDLLHRHGVGRPRRTHPRRLVAGRPPPHRGLRPRPHDVELAREARQAGGVQERVPGPHCDRLAPLDLLAHGDETHLGHVGTRRRVPPRRRHLGGVIRIRRDGPDHLDTVVVSGGVRRAVAVRVPLDLGHHTAVGAVGVAVARRECHVRLRRGVRGAAPAQDPRRLRARRPPAHLRLGRRLHRLQRGETAERLTRSEEREEVELEIREGQRVALHPETREVVEAGAGLLDGPAVGEQPAEGQEADVADLGLADGAGLVEAVLEQPARAGRVALGVDAGVLRREHDLEGTVVVEVPLVLEGRVLPVGVETELMARRAVALHPDLEHLRVRVDLVGPLCHPLQHGDHRVPDEGLQVDETDLVDLRGEVREQLRRVRRRHLVHELEEVRRRRVLTEALAVEGQEVPHPVAQLHGDGVVVREVLQVLDQGRDLVADDAHHVVEDRVDVVEEQLQRRRHRPLGRPVGGLAHHVEHRARRRRGDRCRHLLLAQERVVRGLQDRGGVELHRPLLHAFGPQVPAGGTGPGEELVVHRDLPETLQVDQVLDGLGNERVLALEVAAPRAAVLGLTQPVGGDELASLFLGVHGELLCRCEQIRQLQPRLLQSHQADQGLPHRQPALEGLVDRLDRGVERLREQLEPGEAAEDHPVVVGLPQEVDDRQRRADAVLHPGVELILPLGRDRPDHVGVQHDVGEDVHDRLHREVTGHGAGPVARGGLAVRAHVAGVAACRVEVVDHGLEHRLGQARDAVDNLGEDLAGCGELQHLPLVGVVTRPHAHVKVGDVTGLRSHLPHQAGEPAQPGAQEALLHRGDETGSRAVPLHRGRLEDVEHPPPVGHFHRAPEGMLQGVPYARAPGPQPGARLPRARLGVDVGEAVVDADPELARRVPRGVKGGHVGDGRVPRPVRLVPPVLGIARIGAARQLDRVVARPPPHGPLPGPLTPTEAERQFR